MYSVRIFFVAALPVLIILARIDAEHLHRYTVGEGVLR